MKSLPIKIRRRKSGFEMYGQLPGPGENFSFTLSVDGNKARIRNFAREKETKRKKNK